MKDRLQQIPEQALAEQIKQARFVFICGNGGSASTAEHFATDLFKRGVKAFALSSNTALITMIANDYGYENIFVDQLARYATPEDLIITISCSGTSKNIVYARNFAEKRGLPIYEFETFGQETDFGLLEDKHLAFAHAVAKLI
jgi:D-sedoheptulose 7-phosphate isomerase